MFIRSKTFDNLNMDCMKLRTRVVIAENKYQRLLREWNGLVDKINESGGSEFLEGGIVKNEFSKGEIKTLLSLCHPDKHNGKKSATDITVKLLALR